MLQYIPHLLLYTPGTQVFKVNDSATLPEASLVTSHLIATWVWNKSIDTVRNLLDSFSSVFIFSQVRATQKCVNDSPDVTVLFCKITKVFSLNRTDTNLPTISYQDPSALAFSDIFQKWVSFKPSLDRSFPAGKGLQCWQLCSGLGSGQLNQDHCHISHSYPKST